MEKILWQGEIEGTDHRICEDTSVEFLFSKGTNSEQWRAAASPELEAEAYKRAWLELLNGVEHCLLDDLYGLHPTP